MPLYFVTRITVAHRLFHQLFHKENKDLDQIPGEETFLDVFRTFFEYLAQRAHGPRDVKKRHFFEKWMDFMEISQ